MTFSRGDHVAIKLPQGGYFFGYVLGGFHKLNNELAIVCENEEGAVFVSDGGNISHVPAACHHEEGFVFACEAPGYDHWKCRSMCGFGLNFNPATYPDGVAYRKIVPKILEG